MKEVCEFVHKHCLKYQSLSFKSFIQIPNQRLLIIPFFFQPEKYEYTVIEGEYITISFKSTVPVGCIASHKELMTHCDQSFYAFQPTKNRNFGSCSNNIALKDIIFKAQFCGIKIGITDWQDEQKLEVYGFSDGLYNSKLRSTYIRLSTSAVSPFNEIWQGVLIQDIKVCAKNNIE